MATLKSSALVKVLVPAVLLGAAGIGLHACMSGSLDKMAPLTPEQLREPGIGGGTPQDTQAISDPSDILARGRYNVEILVVRNNREAAFAAEPPLPVTTGG
ncbi:hypothetical protein EO05_26440, partial [Salmonella enterica]|nr:hypothetical protein [Salmonella enterica]EEJ6656965.1 hypothetical protein [Salmonella enterica subsp. enterica serovar Redlands]EAA9928799.1 hypothetical protein [Salmonella enterica]EAO9252027.1 hypothetical protein [Salmonella enterica]EAU0260015.1 hypothetical protein [Salmonella enterica]